VNDCLNWSSQRPISWLYENLDIDAHWCLIHATHADRFELASMAKSGSVAGICPTTEGNLGDGIFPGVDYLTHAGRWGIGSDSHVSLSVVEELRWFEYGQRLRDQRRNRLTISTQNSVGDALYTQALQGGAQACGVAVGQLSVGYRADWLVLDGNSPYLAAAKDSELLNRWLFAGDVGQIRDVYVGGIACINDGQHKHQQVAAADFLNLLNQLKEETV
jgi:formimidoylglutamate deiminase